MRVAKKAVRTIVHENREDAVKQDHHFQKSSDRARVEKLAYELYQKRGCTHGDDLADWFQAEKTIKKKAAAAAK